jgi:hypothetical protein
MGREKGGDTLETRGESVSEVPPARTTTWKSISAGNDGGGGRRRRGFRGSSDYGSRAAGSRGGVPGPKKPSLRATPTRLLYLSRIHPWVQLTVGNRPGYRGNRPYRSGSVRKKLGYRSLTEPSKS